MVKEMIFIINKTEKKNQKPAKKKKKKDPHSLLWVWEFSKKAVLICFTFYVIVQIYSMVVMAVFCDFSNLGVMIEQTADIVKTCVFGYLIKAGIENSGKIWRNPQEPEEIAG